uniref:cytochrome P450 n=1 Tax=Saccharopolyspora galaxeae TaxID=2781241 RepID=UPI00190B7813|nr:cytochrome P450 [Saccharopolyspora sp. HNM0986]
MQDARKIVREESRDRCPVHRDPDGIWQVNGHAAARAVLRSSDTVQAGLGVQTLEKMPPNMRRPVLYRDGQGHRDDRRQTARFFTPRRVDEHYRGVMQRTAEAQMATLRRDGEAHLGDLAFQLAIGVAAEVIGLTESRPGIRRRLERFFPEEFGTPGFTSIDGLRWLLRQVVNWSAIHIRDVRPAVRARWRERRDDVISHLLDEGCSSAEILAECITFAAAGMVTTREFVNLAAWHLLTTPELLARYRAADEPERLAVLHELLRLEPVLGHLRRRTTAPLELSGTTIPAGALVDIALGDTNVDPAEMGAEPLQVCPGREVPGDAAGLSFGDGAHKCPGATIAILETDVFLRELFALPVRMKTPPRVSFSEATTGYELRGLVVAVD